MDGPQTMNLNDDGDGMVPLSADMRGPPQNAPPPMENQFEKNVNKEQKMDSTPIADIMGGPEVMDMGPPPPMAVAPAMQMQMPMMQAPQQPQQQPQAALPSKNPMNLTDEQMQALLVGICAVIAFSNPVQEKLAGVLPQMLAENGSRNMTGMAVTGLVAASLFYFGQRVAMKN